MELPELASTYLLLFSLKEGLQIGTRGKKAFNLKPGTYVYVGSARGRLKSRITRHFSPHKAPFWNIDYLTIKVSPLVSLALSPRYSEGFTAALLSKAFHGVKGFGAADDPLNSTHLFQCECDLKAFLDELADALAV